ncbi:MAG: tRNA pseudouridine(38-40) synthase TruA [Flavobacteriales bacterium]|nr:tRNA pseudouridine(38-40) synthase TruA [Flavobacteriales bacterium]
MYRYFIEIQYKGTHFHGWQIQENAKSVQEVFNKAVSTILKTETQTIGCGRTDTGVHAKSFFAHFDCNEILDSESFLYKLNCILPFDISCKKVFQVKRESNARFSATSRTYEYWITQNKEPFLTEFAYFFPSSLDIDEMNRAAMILIQQNDFSCFSKSNTDTLNNECTITFAAWKKEENRVVFTITANRFLRNMVRAIVGTMLEVGTGKKSTSDIEQIIASKNRSEAGTSVPAHGLYLTKVTYPENILN